MSDHTQHDISKHIRIYIAVFIALLIGTIVTVGLNAIHFDLIAVTVSIALAVAFVKASLVAGFFMHLNAERKVIYVILAVTVLFLLGLVFITLFAFSDFPPDTVTH
jgi:cytochrome c oxidase subunit IV